MCDFLPERRDRGGALSPVWVSRPLRLNVPGVRFHLIARGNVCEFVFIDDLDRRAS